MQTKTGLKSSQCFPTRPGRDDWKETFSFISAACVGRGGSGSVFAIDKERVIKVFPGDAEGRRDLERELAIYRKLGNGKASEHIVKFHEKWESGLVLDRYDSTLRQLLSLPPEVLPTQLALQWAQEIGHGLKGLHSKEILHGDLGCQNIMVDSSNRTKLCDFAGSSFRDGDIWNDAWVSYEVRSQHPKYRGRQPTVETEIFAFGSVIFEIWTSQPPYATESDLVVRRKFLAQDFPLLMIEDFRIRDVVRKCWMGEYECVADTCNDLDIIERVQ